MLTAVRVEAFDVDAALAELGLELETLLEVARAGVLAWASTTANDPPSFPGSTQWARMVRDLRERLLPRGWTKSDESNYSTVVDPTEGIAIAVSSGCANTGKPQFLPTTKSPKGPNTVAAVHANLAQFDLFADAFPVPVPAGADGPVTWLLLFHRDREEVRLELSLPASMGDNGHIDGWKERIVLPSIPLDPVPVPAVPDFGPDISVDIKRRA